MLTVVHVTHEAVHKVGGIGSVLEGLITAEPYRRAVDRTILMAPLFDSDGPAHARLGPDGEVRYSSIDDHTDHPLSDAFRSVQGRFNVDLVYGVRRLVEPGGHRTAEVEVLLIDVRSAAREPVDDLKTALFDAFGLASDRYEQEWDFEQYVRLAVPGLAALQALGACGKRGLAPSQPALAESHSATSEVPVPFCHPDDAQCLIVAHEFMGLPTALAARLLRSANVRTVYHAHEVGTIRRIVDRHSGHDAMFYNVLRLASADGRRVDDVFGDQDWCFRHALTIAARHLDVTLAVGPWVVRELEFLSRDMDTSRIRLAYNGIPARETSPEEAAAAKARLVAYTDALLGLRPDVVFTHVTRMAPSKALWRDLMVMRHVEKAFQSDGRTGVLIVLSTEIGRPRTREDILHMERWWDWPVAHREVPPDLTDGEALFYSGVQAFNARSRNCKIIYINQFGFDRASCGDRMPPDVEFWDIRRGSDVEFGQSIYEPFGIAQLEALSFGAIAVMSDACGCAGFVADVAGPDGAPNVITAPYIDLRLDRDDLEHYLKLGRARREDHDERVAKGVAAELLARLPRTPAQKTALLRRGYELAEQMSWDAVAERFFVPAIRDVFDHALVAAQV